MGGNSTGGAAWQNGGIRFEGNVNTYGCVLDGVALDLSGQSDLLFEYDTLPTPRTAARRSPSRCRWRARSGARSPGRSRPGRGVHAADQGVGAVLALEPKGSHWSYSKSRTGVPARARVRLRTSRSRRSTWHLLPDGPYSLFLHNFGSSTRRFPRRCRAAPLSCGARTRALAHRPVGRRRRRRPDARPGERGARTAARQSARRPARRHRRRLRQPRNGALGLPYRRGQAEIASPTAIVGTSPAPPPPPPPSPLPPPPSRRRRFLLGCQTTCRRSRRRRRRRCRRARRRRARRRRRRRRRRPPSRRASSERRRREERPPDRRRREHHPRRRRRDRGFFVILIAVGAYCSLKRCRATPQVLDSRRLAPTRRTSRWAPCQASPPPRPPRSPASETRDRVTPPVCE